MNSVCDENALFPDGVVTTTKKVVPDVTEGVESVRLVELLTVTFAGLTTEITLS